MPWIVPIGYEDSAGSWATEEEAYDGNPTTAAATTRHFAFSWTGPLNFIFAPCRAAIFHCVIENTESPFEVRFWGRRNGEVVWWEPPVFSAGSHGIDWELEPGLWDKFGIRYRSIAGTWTIGLVNDVRLWCPCLGPLAPICNIFHDIGDWFHNTADDIEPWFVIGEHLTGPFHWAGDRFHDLGDTCCEVSAALQETLDLLPSGLTWDELSALILEHWPTLVALANDPVGWFLVQLTLAFDLEPWHTQSLEFLAKWVLQTYFPTLWDIWFDPGLWIQEHVLPLIEGLPDWLTDPVGWLRAVIEQTFPTLVALANDPVGWFLVQLTLAFDLEPWHTQSLEFLAKWVLQTYFPTLWDIWFDPGLWIQEHVLPLIPELPDFLADPEVWLLETLGRLFSGLVEFLKDPFGYVKSLIPVPGKWLWDLAFDWMDAVQERGTEFEGTSFKVDIGAALKELDTILPHIEEVTRQVMEDMGEDAEIDLPLLRKYEE